MKKNLILFAAILMLLSGCVFIEKKEEVPQATKAEIISEKKIGIVSKVEGAQSSLEPEFVLIAEDGSTVPLKSVLVNLKKYHRRRVELTGRYNDTKSAFIVEATSTLGQEIQSKSTYQNPELGVKLLYPTVWTLTDQKNAAGQTNIRITPYETNEDEVGSIDRITIQRSDNVRRASAREWLGLNDAYARTGANPDEPSATFQASLIGPAQLPAVKKTVGTGETVAFYVPRDTFMYIVTHRSVQDSEKDMYRNGFFDIVASFEFIPFSEASSVTTPISPKPQPPQTPSGEAMKDASADSKLAKLAREELEKRKSLEEKSEPEESGDLGKKKRDEFIAYIQKNIFKIAFEGSEAKPVELTVHEIDFAHPEGKPDEWRGIYVVYSGANPDGSKSRLLLEFQDQSDPAKFTVAASFGTGETTDWKLLGGQDGAKGLEKTHIVLGADAGQSMVLKKGMSLLDARQFKIKLQYPSSWYWAYVEGTYFFDTKAVTAANAPETFIRLSKMESLLPYAESKRIDPVGGREASEAVGESYLMCVQGTHVYCMSGDSTTVRQILENLVEE